MQKSLTNTKPLMPQEFEPDEKWEIKTGDGKFIISGKQAEILKRANTQGLRGLIWFNDFAVSIAHISSVTRIQKGSKTQEQERKEYANKFGF